MGCKGKKKDGGDCKMRPAAGQEYCINHGGTAAEGGETKKTAGKGSAAAQEKSESGAGAIVAGVAIGALLAAGLVYAALRFARPATSGTPNLRAVA